MVKYIITLSTIFVLTSCSGPGSTDPSKSVTPEKRKSGAGTNNIQLADLGKKKLNDTIKANLNVVDDGINYMPSYTKQSKEPITDELKAWEAIKELYPDFAKKIKCRTEYKGYYVFSIGFNDPKIDCLFRYILYVKKNDKEFKYFWPAT